MASEDDIKVLIDEHLSSKGWDRDTSLIKRNWSISRLFPHALIQADKARKRPDYTIYLDNNPVLLIEAKRPEKDLMGALEEAKEKAKIIKEHAGVDIPLIFASDGSSISFLCPVIDEYRGRTE